MIRRLNYTGRRKIPRENIHIALFRNNGVDEFDAVIRLLPDDATHWTAGQQGQNVTNVAAEAVARASYTNALAAQLTRNALLRNVKIAEGYQCTNTAGLADMRRGQSPTIQRGSFQGDQLSVDHIIPRAVCPELDNVIANLELMPMRVNESKNAKVGPRQLQKAQELHRAGLLSESGLKQVHSTAR